MKIIRHEEGAWSDKVNFVDQNNVFLGYDVGQSCCENAGWYISDYISNRIGKENYDQNLDDYYFDTSFRQSLTESMYDEGGIEVFKITNGEDEKYIHIYNSHNGYYGHGFEFKIGEEIKEHGRI